MSKIKELVDTVLKDNIPVEAKKQMIIEAKEAIEDAEKIIFKGMNLYEVIWANFNGGPGYTDYIVAENWLEAWKIAIKNHGITIYCYEINEVKKYT